MVNGYSARSADIDAVLDSGTWETGEPKWSGVPDFSAPDGAKSVTWQGQGGQGGAGTKVVTAKACRETESVVIIIHDPDKKNYKVGAEVVLADAKQAFDLAIATLRLEGSFGTDGLYSVEEELVDVYGSPEVKYNVTVDGTARIGFTNLTGQWSTGPISAFGVTLIEDFIMQMVGSLTADYTLNKVKHDWSVPDGTFFTGWTGSLTGAGRMIVTGTNSVEIPVNVFGIRSAILATEGRVVGALSATGDLTAKSMTFYLGIEELKVGVRATIKMNSGQQYTLTIPVNLGWLAPSITIGPIRIDTSTWKP